MSLGFGSKSRVVLGLHLFLFIAEFLSVLLPTKGNGHAYSVTFSVQFTL